MAPALTRCAWHDRHSLDFHWGFKLLYFLWEGSVRLSLLRPPESLLLGLRGCFLGSHRGRSKLLSNAEQGRRPTLARYHAHIHLCKASEIPCNQRPYFFFAFFLATTHFKNQNPQIIAKTSSTPQTPYPCRMLHCFTHSFWRSKNLQEKQWKGPGPQQPTSEHRGSQTCLAAAGRERQEKPWTPRQYRGQTQHFQWLHSDQPVSPTCSKADVNGPGSVEEE